MSGQNQAFPPETVGGQQASNVREKGVYVNEYGMSAAALMLLAETVTEFGADAVLKGEVEIGGENLFTAMQDLGIAKVRSRGMLVADTNQGVYRRAADRFKANNNALTFVVGQMNSTEPEENGSKISDDNQI